MDLAERGRDYNHGLLSYVEDESKKINRAGERIGTGVIRRGGS